MRTVSRRKKAPTPGDVYRRAARMVEEEMELFPCFAVGRCTPGGERNLDWCSSDTLAGRFILALAPEGDWDYEPRRASKAYIEEAIAHFQDHSILALCFAAAMADTGDL